MIKKRIFIFGISLVLLLSLILSACEFPPAMTGDSGKQASQGNAPTTTPTPEKEAANDAGESSADPTQEETPPTPTATTTQTPTEPPAQAATDNNEGETEGQKSGVYGPDTFPEGINPLTGLPAKDPELLNLPPALLSISNFPASARPQAGLNSSPIIFEMTIGEGMTRFLAMFYGGFPEFASGQTEGTPENTPGIGPIRSGRLPYESLRASYNGFLVMASAYSGVAQTLSDATSIYGSDGSDINSALISIDKLYDIAQVQSERVGGKQPFLAGMSFSETPPEGGQKAEELRIFYSSFNQIHWVYDPDLGAFIRHDITTDGSNQFPTTTDRLTGEPVSKENVIVLFAIHDFKAPTLIDIQLTNMPPLPALLFRDGQVYEIFWTTQFGDFEKDTGLLRPIRFVDAVGNPVPLKPGQTWVQIVSDYSYILESAWNENPFYALDEEPGSGLWLVRYKGKY